MTGPPSVLPQQLLGPVHPGLDRSAGDAQELGRLPGRHAVEHSGLHNCAQLRGERAEGPPEVAVLHTHQHPLLCAALQPAVHLRDEDLCGERLPTQV